MTLPLVAYYTGRMGFLIQAGTDQASYEDIVNALLKTDGASGLILCTEATKPTTNKFPGMYIKCTDSSKHYYLDASGTWTSGVYSGGAWVEDIYLTVVSVASGNGNMIYGANDTTSYSAACDNSQVSNTTFAAGKAPINVVTVTNGQIVDFELTLGVSINWGATASESNAAAVNIAQVYVTIDGSDVIVGKLTPNDLNCQNTSATAVGNGHAIIRFNLTKSITTAGTHACSVKVITGQFNVTSNSSTTFAVDNINLKALVSVA